MKIIENGKYPEGNVAQCKECGCKFQYYNSEIIVDATTPEEESLFCGFGVYKYIECPCCKENVEISHYFEEKTPITTKIKNWFEKRKENGKDK